MVPSDVTLTDEIALLHEKVFNVQLTLERGQLIFKASLRVRSPTSPPLDLLNILLAYSTCGHHSK